jgi:hypothetical protein
MRIWKLLIICTGSVFFFACQKTIIQPEQVVLAESAHYGESRTLRLPGNYQNWDVASAPKIVSSNGDSYEGYVHFTNPSPQFYLVRGTTWDNVTTYNQTGPDKFGFNGTFFSVSAGAGIYKVNANTKNYTWSCTKINSWGLHGTAVSADANTDADMIADATTLSWRITRNLVKGDFLFRANKSNAIVFGYNGEGVSGVPDYNGERIPIAQAGNYTIVLSLQKAGNYTYSIQKNS